MESSPVPVFASSTPPFPPPVPPRGKPVSPLQPIGSPPIAVAACLPRRRSDIPLLSPVLAEKPRRGLHCETETPLPPIPGFHDPLPSPPTAPLHKTRIAQGQPVRTSFLASCLVLLPLLIQRPPETIGLVARVDD